MGTGPFVLKSRDLDTKTVLVAHAGWWDKPKHNLAEVVFMPIKADATRTSSLVSGNIDMTVNVPLQDVARLKAGGLEVVQGPELRTIFLGMDQHRDELLYSDVKGRNPFKDRRVREAFLRAIDIETIRARIMRGESPAAIPLEDFGETRLIVNLDAARTLGVTISPSLVRSADEVLGGPRGGR